MPNDFNQQIIDEFRANAGRVGGPFEGGRLLLLTTTGARTGARHTTPLGYLPDGERMLIIASAGGAPAHPAWYHNLARRAERHRGGRRLHLPGAGDRPGRRGTRPRLRPRGGGGLRLGRLPGQDEPGHPRRRARPRSTAGRPPGRLGDTLVAIHDAFRRELALIRKEVAESGPGLGAQLRVNCLTLCQGLHHHHTIEDGGMFPYVEDAAPRTRPGHGTAAPRARDGRPAPDRAPGPVVRRGGPTPACSWPRSTGSPRSWRRTWTTRSRNWSRSSTR